MNRKNQCWLEILQSSGKEKKKKLARSVTFLYLVHLKKKILTIFKMAARQRFSSICIGFLLTQSDLCPSTLWFSHYNNDFDCLFTILFEHFCLPHNIYWTSAVSFIGTCCIGTSIVCKFLKVKREIGSYPHLVDQENKGFQWNYSDLWEGESELGQDI